MQSEIKVVKQKPLLFYFALHLHQPVGNFDEVFESHVNDVYLPLIDKFGSYDDWPLTVHISGPLIDWCIINKPELIQKLRTLALKGRIEFLLSGYYEPILATLPSFDRLQQIACMKNKIQDVFGVSSTGLWLTERVWEQDLARDLSDAGVRYTLVDDRAFIVSGHDARTMGSIFRTEHDNRSIDLLPIDESLRYLIPFRPVEEIELHLSTSHSSGRELVVFADDAEKFGGWPGTKEWVFESGWLENFIRMILGLQNQGIVRIANGNTVLREAPKGGITYLPSSSYREMEEWSLPVKNSLLLNNLKNEIEESSSLTRTEIDCSPFIRGSHWKNFLVKYEEANRLHKYMLALSSYCRKSGDPIEARTAIAKAQSNDPYWHGVFGGLYLPWLREANWNHLALAERILRQGASLSAEIIDTDFDGQNEIWIHGSDVSVIIAPHRGASIETWMLLGRQQNACDTLTRRVEAYHHHAVNTYTDGDIDIDRIEDGAPSIHDLESMNKLETIPDSDPDVRSLIQVREIPDYTTREEYEKGNYSISNSWVSRDFEYSINKEDPSQIIVSCENEGLLSQYVIQSDGSLRVAINWSRKPITLGKMLAIEISLAARCPITISCKETHTVWQYDILTRAKSERGIESTVQGIAFVLLFRPETACCEINLVSPQPNREAGRPSYVDYLVSAGVVSEI